MRSATTRQPKAFRRLTALALGLWLSGAGCLVCCERAGAAAHEDAPEETARAIVAAAREASGDGPKVSSDHSCCTARVGSRARKAMRSDGAGRGEEAPAARPAEAEGRDAASLTGEAAAREKTAPRGACCRRALRLSEEARKPRAEQAPAGAPSAAAALVPARSTGAPLSLVARPRAPDRAGTHLRCCVFLI